MSFLVGFSGLIALGLVWVIVEMLDWLTRNDTEGFR